MSIDIPQIRVAARNWRVVRCFTLFVAAATAIPSQAADIEVRRNIAYTEPADTSRRSDVYTADEAKDWPIMVWIHGGGWKRGDKAGVQAKPVAFIDHKFVFVCFRTYLVWCGGDQS